MPKKVKVVYLQKQEDLQKIANARGSVRVGSTSNPAARASSYDSGKYSGNMFVAKTKNMMQSEDRLLKNSDARHNVHRVSNAQKTEGYIYVINGQKRN